jgi:hypothetical protein
MPLRNSATFMETRGAGRLRSTCDTVTYVYADVVGTVRAGEVIFELSREDLVYTRRAH